MNKKLLVPIIVAVLLVLFGGGYAFYIKSSNVTKTNQAQNATGDESATETSSAPSSLRELLGMATNQKCTYTDNEFGSEGTVYVANEKMRGDFEINTDGTMMNSHTIVDGQTMYVWTDGQTQGYKMTLTQDDEVATEDEESASPITSESVDLDKQVDYSCSGWPVDNSVFDLPSGVDFKDMNQMMESITGMMENGSDEETESVQSTKEDQCEYCNSLPDSAKQQCLTAFGC